MKLALHSVSYAGIWPGQARLTVEEIIDKAAACGYGAVMLMAKRPHVSPLDMPAERRQALRRRMEDHGLRLAMLAGYNDFCGGADQPDVPYREMQVLYIEELARLTRDLGGDKLRVFTGFERAHVSYDQQWSWCVEGLKEAARRAAACGVTLCVQNHHDMAVDHDGLFDLLTEIDEPNCRAAFDAWSPALQGVDLVAAVRRLGPLIAHTTVADYVLRPRYKYQPRLVNYERQTDVVRAVGMGDGFIDYRSFFRALAETGFDGYVAYEMCSVLQGGGSPENLDAKARQFVDWMRKNTK